MLDIEDFSKDTPISRRQTNDVKSSFKQSRDSRQSSTQFLPGQATIYSNTWGCSHNMSDSEYMLGLLQEQGYTITNNKDIADIWLLNSCTVKNPSEMTFKNEIAAAELQGKRVVLAGCVTQADPMSYSQSIIGVNQIDKIVHVVEETLQGRQVQLLESSTVSKLHLPKVRKNKYVEIIAINSGCLNQCTYCKTKHARGDLRSYPIQDIVDRCVQVIKDGVVEIWLTSEDTGTYGRDIKSSLPELLQQIEKVIPDSGVMVRVGMTNPPYIREHLQDIADILNNPKFYAFLHIPVQSGNNRVLDAMKREYTRQEFQFTVDFLRLNVKNITIATDIICGFPTETDAEFESSLSLVQQYQFPVLHISQFYSRPGTPAARLPKINTKVIKERSRKMTILFNSYQTFTEFRSAIFDRVLITEWGAVNNKPALVGHNKYYHQVLIPVELKNGKKTHPLMGKMALVRILKTQKWHIEGELIEFSDYKDLMFLATLFMTFLVLIVSCVIVLA
eukprot:NODE_265_length_12372_cov_0.450012.p2 type:complete len:503 gc:universal NODE_265_length_12372_cov_0.450012:7347-5839(-)